jgi:hypothetical protein
MVKRELLYPIFIQCIKYTDDLFWKEIFEEMSYNNCYTGTFINKGTYCSVIKNKEFTYKFSDKDPETICKDIIKHLKTINIMSKNDKKNLLDEFANLKKNIEETIYKSWEDIKKKNIKDMLFQNFLIEMKHKWGLKNIQIKKLYSFINLGIILKSIKGDTINYKNGKIESINGIVFNEGKYEINFNLYSHQENKIMSSDDNNYLSSK